MLIRSDYLWEFVSRKLTCGTDNELEAFAFFRSRVYGYVLSSRAANVEDMEIKEVIYSSVTIHHFSRILERTILVVYCLGESLSF